jgi:hypothetical protein
VAAAALLLRSDQLLGLLGSASGKFAQRSSGMAVATAAAELPPPTVPDCHTQFWKVNRMRTMYVLGSKLTYDSS